jgi:hypothetical protein
MHDANGLGGGLTPVKVVYAWSHWSFDQQSQALQGDPKVSPDSSETLIFELIFGFAKKPGNHWRHNT